MSEVPRETSVSVRQQQQQHANLKRTDQDIKEAAKLWVRDPAAAETMYGHISRWDTSVVTDMSRLFYNATNFNEDLSNWMTANVTTTHTPKSLNGVFGQAIRARSDSSR